MKAALKDVLACPSCHGEVRGHDDGLICSRCAKTYPVVHGVPVMKASGVVETAPSPPLRDGYDPWISRRTMATLIGCSGGRAVIVDLGSGNKRLDVPGVIRMDNALSEHVDLVADAHQLPFRDGVVDMVFSHSVLEHLRDPFEFANEMNRVLRPGGYLYHDTNFVFPYHGFPHHYFNFSPHGLSEVFRKFRMIRHGVPPYHAKGLAAIRAYMRGTRYAS